MIPVGQAYRAEGRVDARALLSATILGVVTAVAAAAVVWAWEISPIPTLVIITPILQGILIGAVLIALTRRLKLRHPGLMFVVGAACGLGSIALLHYAHYLHFLDESGKLFVQARAAALASDDLEPDKKKMIEAMDAKTFSNNFLLDRTGHAGFVGSLLFRAEQGYQIKKMHISGVGTWVLWGFELSAVVLAAAAMARGQALMPFCEDCGSWCSKAASPVQLAGDASPALADAVRTDDTRQAQELFSLPVDAERLQAAGTRIALHSCETCDQTFADVETYTVRVKKGKTETVTRPLLRQIRVSPEMTALLRSPPADSTWADDPAEATEDEFHPDGTPLEDRTL